MNENMMESKANSLSHPSGNDDNNDATTNKAESEVRIEKVQESTDIGPEQDSSSPLKNNQGSDKEILKGESAEAESSDGKNQSMSHPLVGMNSTQERNADSGGAVAVETPSHTFRGGMAYPSPANYPMQNGGSYYSNYGEPQMRGSPMGPMGSGPDNQQWRHYNPRDNPPFHPSVGGGAYIPQSTHGPQSPYHRNHHHQHRHTMGSPPGHPSIGRGSIYGVYSPEYESPSRYYETIHNMSGGVMGARYSQGGPYGMHSGTMSSPYQHHPMQDNVIYRGGGGMGSPSGVDVPSNYSSPFAIITTERQKRPFEDVSPGIHVGGEHVASVKKEERFQREKEGGDRMSTTRENVGVVRRDGENIDNKTNVHVTAMETPDKDEKRQSVEESIDVKTPDTESKYPSIPSSEARVETRSNHGTLSSKGEMPMVSTDKAVLLPGSLSQQDPNAGPRSAPNSDPHTSKFAMNNQARDRMGGSDGPAFYTEHGTMRAGAEAPFPSPEGIEVPYRGYGRGRFEGAPGGGYYDEPPPPSHGGYTPYGPPPPHVYPGYGHPPPSHGYYYDGMNEYYQGSEYDGAMYYNRMYGGPSPHSGPEYMHGDPRNAPPPSGMMRSHPRTPYGAPYASLESPQKPYVTPDSRTHPFVGSGGHGSNPPGTGLTPGPNFPPRHPPAEEGEYTKLVRSKSARLTDRKKLQNKAWFDRFEDLKKYKEEHGDCMVPQKYPPNPR
jgi:hypothetical protein